MAGTVENYDKYKETREYPYSRSKTGTRTHRNNGQGRAMVKALNKRGKASRFAWPAFEGAGGRMQAEATAVIDRYVAILNAKLRTP
jgi:hypothetical protein